MIKAYHKDYEIVYHEDKNEWTCAALKLHSSSLAALKDKINAFESAERKLGEGGVAVVHFGYDVMRDVYKAKATMLDADGHGVWITKADDRKSRSKVGPHSLTPDIPAAWETIEEARKLDKQGRELCAAARKLIDGLPRMTRESLAEAKLETKPE